MKIFKFKIYQVLSECFHWFQLRPVALLHTAEHSSGFGLLQRWHLVAGLRVAQSLPWNVGKTSRYLVEASLPFNIFSFFSFSFHLDIVLSFSFPTFALCAFLLRSSRNLLVRLQEWPLRARAIQAAHRHNDETHVFSWNPMESWQFEHSKAQ